VRLPTCGFKIVLADGGPGRCLHATKTCFWGLSMRRSPARLGSPARAAATCTMLVFLLPLVLQVEAQKIKIQYEKTTDFSKFKTHMQGRDAVNCMVKGPKDGTTSLR